MGWVPVTTLALSVLGLVDSAYQTYTHYAGSGLLGCSASGDACVVVQHSAEAYVFGIPVAVLGMVFYVFVVAIMSPWAWRWAQREVYLIRLAAMLAGIGFVLYLLYAELFLIGSICLYCTSVHAITFALFVLTAFAAAAWGIPKNQHG